jgi:hypothetical protein
MVKIVLDFYKIRFQNIKEVTVDNIKNDEVC